ncbi:Cytidylate kinase [Buchnera aphidicola (Sipha maydis)]|uniref:(d)CMP kinase n=1 Tax=Buchnera aphidicola TaxID=9 RepID=UPI0034640A92
MIKKYPVITIDGASGVGKSTLSYSISKKLNWNFLESGYMYRIMAYYIIKYDLSLKKKNIISLFPYINFDFKYMNNGIKVFFKNKDISNEIHSEKISMMASKIAIFPYVRNWLLNKQRKFRRFPGLVTNGRDMGTMVFPDAIVKIFLKKSLLERAKKRKLDLRLRGFKMKIEKIIKDIKQRDYRDKNRILCPLFPAKDAIIIDSTSMSLEKTLKKSMNIIYKKLLNK